MQVLVAFEGLLKDLYLLFALEVAPGRISFALPVALHLVQLDHLLDTFKILLLDVELELQL